MSDTSDTDPEDVTETELGPDPIDLVDRLTLKAAILILPELRELATGAEAVASDRVRLAADKAIIAIAERVGRAMRRDLPAEQG